MRLRLMLAAVGCLVATSSHSHGGGLNAEGCHHDRKHGGYHCHRPPAVVQRAPPTTLAASPGVSRPQPVAAIPPTCYVGPRGGRYTITASGRKNYKGC